MFIELCKISKLVMHLNSCSMDLGCDRLCLLRGLAGWLSGCLTRGQSGEVGSRGSTALDCSAVVTLLPLPPLFGSKGRSLLESRPSGSLTS